MRRRGFTLIELLVVLCIMAVLMAMLIPTVMYIRDWIRRAKTVALVKVVDQACLQYKNDRGQYPWTPPEKVTPATTIEGYLVYAKLRGMPPLASANDNADCLQTLDASFINSATDPRKPRIKDAWGSDLCFRVDPVTSAPVIWSFARNRVDDTNVGASPNPAKQPQTYYAFFGASAGDDISNR